MTLVIEIQRIGGPFFYKLSNDILVLLEDGATITP